MSEEVSIFFDTEFTNFEKPDLISLGAVSIDGQHEFYAEVIPLPSNCSRFVQSTVLPQLNGPTYSKAELAQQFILWLALFDCDIELYSDSTYDRNLLYDLCGYPLPLPRGLICRWFPLPKRAIDLPHHALKDALLLCEEFRTYF